MPHPREAIYDVLKSKSERQKEAERLEAAWKEYEEQNRQAASAHPLTPRS